MSRRWLCQRRIGTAHADALTHAHTRASYQVFLTGNGLNAPAVAGVEWGVNVRCCRARFLFGFRRRAWALYSLWAIMQSGTKRRLSQTRRNGECKERLMAQSSRSYFRANERNLTKRAFAKISVGLVYQRASFYDGLSSAEYRLETESEVAGARCTTFSTRRGELDTFGGEIL